MILIGIGSNLPSAAFGPPVATVAAALAALPELGVGVSQRSAWYCTEPVPRSDQPWFVNGVASLATTLSPAALLAELLALEHRFGRVRGAVNAARVLDLDLLDYDGMVVDGDSLILPHPRLHQRRFVLAPLAELAPNWTHPLLRRTASELLVLLPPGDTICRLPG